MGWKQERDSLIAQTLAFVHSVAGKKDESVRPRAAAVDLDELAANLDRLPPPPIETPKAAPKVVVPVEPIVRATAPAPVKPAQSAEVPPGIEPPSPPARRPIVQSEMQEEIRSRVASFRAHQERFNREREQYFSATLARLRAAIKDQPTSRIGK
jgi:hypothetical protein